MAMASLIRCNSFVAGKPAQVNQDRKAEEIDRDERPTRIFPRCNRQDRKQDGGNDLDQGVVIGQAEGEDENGRPAGAFFAARASRDKRRAGPGSRKAR